MLAVVNGQEVTAQDIAAEARARGANLVVAYHPPMFAPVKRVPHGALWAGAVRDNIALYSMHTALDVAAGGTNELLLRACGVEEMKPIRPFAKPTEKDPPGIGVGRIGDLPAPTTLGALAATLKAAYALERVLLAGAEDRPVKRVAVCAGAGGEVLADARKQGADVFVTGELRHHDALLGTAIIATLHSNSERAAVRDWARRLELGVEVVISDADRDPFYFF